MLRAFFNRALHEVPLLRGNILDVGGERIPPSSYFDILSFDGAAKLTVVNIDAASQPDLVADAAALPCQDALFDHVLCFNLLEHVIEPGRVISEIYRVMKSGGTVLLETPFLVRVHGHPDDHHRFTDSALRVLLSKNGFVDILVTPLGRGPMTAGVSQYLGILPRFIGIIFSALAFMCDAVILRFRPQFLNYWPLGYFVSCRKPSQAQEEKTL